MNEEDGPLEYCYQLDQELGELSWSRGQWAQSLKEPRYKIFLSEEKCGMALFEVNETDGWAHLLKIIIEPNERSKGEGRALLDLALKDLSRASICVVTLEVKEGSNAVRFYESYGFKVTHRVRNYYSTGAGAIKMLFEMSSRAF